jgi:hypothetical protein
MIFRLPVLAKKIAFTTSLGLIISLQPLSALGALPKEKGWGYYLQMIVILLNGDSPYIVYLIDPPADDPILSGRITLKFDPSWTVKSYGWLGQFGANPNLAAPAVGTTEFSESLLQINANPLMQSSDITINETSGAAVFEFDWGNQGFVPTQNVNSSGQFNLAAILFSTPSVPTASDLTPYGIVGSPQETDLLGTQSSTYMLCKSGYCGSEPVPEPLTIFGSATALGFIPFFKKAYLTRQNKSKKIAKKQKTKLV